MKIDKNKTVAFSGHRSFKMANTQGNLFGSDETTDAALSGRIDVEIRKLIARGYDTFLCGMAEGFDLLAGERVAALGEEFPDIRLIAVVPHPGQADRFDAQSRARYDALAARAYATVTLCSHYRADCYHRRNDYLVDNSTALVCYYNGSKGGTEYTVKRAMRMGVTVINVL